MRSSRIRTLFALLVVAGLSVLASIPAIGQELPPETPDPEGDTIDFAGNPADGPDMVGVTAVEVIDYEGLAAWDLFGKIFGYVASPGDVTVIPEEPGPLLGGNGPLILVRAHLAAQLPDAAHCQIVIAFTTEGHEQFSGSAGDPNNGNDTTLDVFLQNGEWVTGRDEYRGGSFSFVTPYQEIAARIDESTITVVFPRDAIPDGASWQIWVICGADAISAGRDFTDLGSFLPAVIPTVSVNPPTTTTVAEITTTTGVETTTTTVPDTTPTTVAEEEPASGGGTNLLIIVVSLAVGGAGLLWWLFNRKREGPCDCEMEKTAYDAALASYAAAESELGDARQVADDWRGRQSEARSDLVALDALRPRRGEFSDSSGFETADAEYQARRVELESTAAACEGELAQAEERVRFLEGQASERWDEAQTWLGIVKACWQNCFNAPFDPKPGPTPAAAGASSGATGGESDDGDDPRDTPPPAGAEPECAEPQFREEVERTRAFTVPVDGMVHVSLSTDRGPLDGVNEIVAGNPVADTIAEFLSPEGSLDLAPESLTGANARRWQDAIEEMRGLSYAVVHREIYVNIAFEVEDVTVDCVRSDECKNGRWVVVGRRTVETSRVRRTSTHTWAESESGGRPLGATMTAVNREAQTAASSARDLSEFRAKCR